MAGKDAIPVTSIQDLLDAGLHFGHQTKRWNPSMKPYIFGERNGIYIIDLSKTLAKLTEAQEFIYDTVVRGRHVLLVGTKKQAQEPIKELAQRFGQPYVIHRWLGGMLTNIQTIRGSVARMRDLEAMQEDGRMEKLSKKEVSRLRREMMRLQRNLSGVADMESLPSALIVFDINRESIAVTEAKRLNIPVVALVDTNSDPASIEYPIPGNDDGTRAIRLVANVLGETILHASNAYAQLAAEEARRKALEAAEAEKKRQKVAAERKAKEKEEQEQRAQAAKEAEAKAKVEAKAKAKVKAEAEAKAKAEAAAQPAEPAPAETPAAETAAGEKPAPAPGLPTTPAE